MSGRECSEWQGIMAMDAIGLASADESRELAVHLDHCEECRGDAADVRSAGAALAFLDAAQFERLDPGTDLWATPVEAAQVPGPTGIEAATLAGLSDAAPADAASSGEVPVGAAPAGAGRSDELARRRAEGTRRRWMVGAGVAIGAVAAAAAALLITGGTPAPPTRTVALTGEPGVVASVSLTAQSWGTRATLLESGQAGGQAFTVSMRSASGRWWVAGSYRTTGRSGTVEVPLSCAVQAGQITTVWVSDQAGHRVMSGYVS